MLTKRGVTGHHTLDKSKHPLSSGGLGSLGSQQVTLKQPLIWTKLGAGTNERECHLLQKSWPRCKRLQRMTKRYPTPPEEPQPWDKECNDEHYRDGESHAITPIPVLQNSRLDLLADFVLASATFSSPGHLRKLRRLEAHAS